MANLFLLAQFVLITIGINHRPDGGGGWAKTECDSY